MATTIEQLCARHNVDMAHARHVAAMSLALFDGLPKVHKVHRSQRDLLEAAGLLHNIAFASNPEEHHTVGRDLILAETLSGFSPEERDLLACTTLFHRKKVKPRKEPVFERLRPLLQERTLALAALLRVGDALDYSQTQTSRIMSIEQTVGLVRVVVDGPHADEEAARANRKADLWAKVFSQPLRAMSVSEAAAERLKSSKAKANIVASTSSDPSVSDKKESGIRGDDPMDEAGRKLLRFYFARLLRNKASVRKDENIVALHRMRIATRRLRAAMRLFGPYLPAKQVRRVEKGLRQMARVLGSVRDFDVLLNKAQNYSENIPENKQRSLELLLRRWHKQRAKARKKMMKSFRSRTGESVWDAFEDFLHEKPETDNVERKGASVHRPRGDLLHYIAPTLIWKRYDRIRRYETVVNGASVETLHKLRIQCKRLRYTLELLHEILGASVESAIAQVKKAQDYLGELHDTDVTAHLVQDFLDRCARRRKRRAIAAADVKGVTDYLAACEKEIEEKIKHFSIIWEELVSEQFRTLLGELTATP